MKLSWLDVKQKGAEELVLIYQQLVQDLKAIQTPPELLTPFVKKVAEIQTAVQNLKDMGVDFKPVPHVQAADKTGAKGPAPASSAPLDTPESLLLSSTVKEQIPAHLWNEWEKGVQEKRRDYLFHLVSTFELESAPIKLISPALKGLVLLQGGAPSEAYAMVESAPDSPYKTDLLTQFERRKP